MHKYEANLEKIIDRTLTARYGLWSAMLAAHTVFLSVAVALASLPVGADTWQFRYVAYAAILSVMLISSCFITSKAQYEDIGKRLAHFEEERSEQDLTRDIRSSSIRFHVSKWFEIASGVFMNLEALLLLSAIPA